MTRAIIGGGMKVHSRLGPGLLESIYEQCLCHELSRAHHIVQRQVECPVRYDGLVLAKGLRLDLLVDDTVIVEIKAIETVLPIHEAQLLTYLRLTGKRIGLLLNFNVCHFRNGITRKVL